MSDVKPLYGKRMVMVVMSIKQPRIQRRIRFLEAESYLIADDCGKSRRRIWRFYSIFNLPQNTPLDNHKNLEKLVSLVCDAFVGAFRPYDMEMELKMSEKNVMMEILRKVMAARRLVKLKFVTR